MMEHQSTDSPSGRKASPSRWRSESRQEEAQWQGAMSRLATTYTRELQYVHNQEQARRARMAPSFGWVERNIPEIIQRLTSFLTRPVIAIPLQEDLEATQKMPRIQIPCTRRPVTEPIHIGNPSPRLPKVTLPLEVPS